MSLSGTEWQEYAVFERALHTFKNKDLTEEEKYVSIWLKQKVEELLKKK